jgi:hypothetical protein
MGIHDGTRIARYGESFPDTFAGRWKEPDDSWVVVFTDEVDHHSAAIRKLVYAPDNVRVVQFRFSYRHLLTGRDRIVDILGTKEGLTSRGPDVKNNCVIVQVLPERLDDVRRNFMTTNPDDVRVELGTPVIPA